MSEKINAIKKELLSSEEIAKTAVLVLDRRKASEIKALYVKDLTIIADYFVIGRAGNNTHAKSLVGEIEKELEEKGVLSRARDGYNSEGWVVIDFGVIMVHIFYSDEGKFYQEALEKVWIDAKTIDFINKEGEDDL